MCAAAFCFYLQILSAHYNFYLRFKMHCGQTPFRELTSPDPFAVFSGHFMPSEGERKGRLTAANEWVEGAVCLQTWNG